MYNKNMRSIIYVIILCIVTAVSFFAWRYWQVQIPPEPTLADDHNPLDLITSRNPADLDPFETLIKRVPRPELSDVLETTHFDVYTIMSCDRAGLPEQVVMLTAKYREDPVLNTFEDAGIAIQNWESYILQDIGHLIFPTFPDSAFGSRLEFDPVPYPNDHRTRRAEFDFNSGRYSVHYGWVLNYVFFASSVVCLEAAMATIYEHKHI